MFFNQRRKLVEARENVKFWRSRAESCEKKVEELTKLLLERDFKWADRFLVSVAKTYAIHDEVKRDLEPSQQDFDEAELDAYLADKKAFLLQCALEAFPEPEAIRQSDITFRNNLESYKAEFLNNAI